MVDFQNILDTILGMFKNSINYAIKGIALVLVSYTFRFLTRWATGAVGQMLLQFVIMSVSIYLLDSLLYLLLPPQIAAETCPEKECPPCVPGNDKCDCTCNCQYPSPVTKPKITVPNAPVLISRSTPQKIVSPSPANNQDIIENF